MTQKGLISILNEIFEFAIKCRDKYLSKDNKSALKLQELMEKQLALQKSLGKTYKTSTSIRNIESMLKELKT